MQLIARERALSHNRRYLVEDGSGSSAPTPTGIRVNAVAPGIVAVGLAKRQWDTEPGYRRRAEKASPLGHMQPPESVADAVIFLCSPASDYMTGATVLVDGGCSLYPMD